jgi:hypothetical protein
MATAAFCGVLLAFALAYRHFERRRQQDLPRGSSDKPDTTLILPVVSNAWSNITVRPAATRGVLTSQRIPSPELPQSVTETNLVEVPNPTAMQARVRELLAQLSVASIGIDPEAEQYWLAAINDLNVSAEDRRNLIQALEEAGFSSHLSAEDLPLIVSRIALIEQLVPNAIDSENAAALHETYQGLLNMFAAVAEPVAPAPTTAE